jgi:hypothetical protein
MNFPYNPKSSVKLTPDSPIAQQFLRLRVSTVKTREIRDWHMRIHACTQIRAHRRKLRKLRIQFQRYTGSPTRLSANLR